MFDLFSKKSKKKIDELNLEIENLNNMLKYKDRHIEELRLEISRIEKEKNENEKNFKIRHKQMEILEKNLRNMRDNNNLLKADKKILKNSALNANLPLEKHKYKIPLDRYFSSLKFKEIVHLLKNENLYFLNELNDEVFKKYTEIDEKKTIDMEKKYNAFLRGDIELETKIYVLKGEKISKLFSRNRKFYTYMNLKNFEHVDDIKDFDFKKLKEEGFKQEQITELVEKLQNYYKKFLIRREER